MIGMTARGTLVAAGALLALVSGCDRVVGFAEELFDRPTARERYEVSLELARLSTTALVLDWKAAGDRAFRDAPLVASPHREDGVILPAEPAAVAFRIEVRRGQVVHFEFQLPSDTSAQVFLDAWEVIGTGSAGPLLSPQAAADSGARSLMLEPRRDGTYLVRAQPELLRGGRFTTTVTVGPTLAFPVERARDRDIGSIWGDPRGNGRRHEGIDIFARRGTPVLAAGAGRVARVGTSTLGGNVVWVRDDRGYSHYYAHLDQAVAIEGSRIVAGDTIGFVGNSGNARRTPPHLHFGIYRRGEGAVNPIWFVRRPGGTVARLAADTTLLGAWGRTATDGVVLVEAPAPRAEALATLTRHAAFRVVSAVGSWYRVVLPSGQGGYLPARGVEPARAALGTEVLAGGEPILARPPGSPGSDLILDEALPAAPVEVLGRYQNHLLIRTPAGTDGWLAR